MDYSVKLLNAEYSSLLEGYSGLFIVRLANLCVKSNPISLIPVIVDHPLGEKNIEEVADASVPDDDHIDVYPKLEDDIFVIGKGILEAQTRIVATYYYRLLTHVIMNVNRNWMKIK